MPTTQPPSADDPQMLGSEPLDPRVRRIATRARLRHELEVEVERTQLWERRFSHGSLRPLLLAGLVAGLFSSGFTAGLGEEGGGAVFFAMLLRVVLLLALLVLVLKLIQGVARHRRLMSEAMLEALPEVDSTDG